MPKRIALFGGSFNPPTIGHVMAALGVLKTGLVDEVWVEPVFKHAFGKDLASYLDRMTMCHAAFRGIDRIRVCNHEEQTNDPEGKTLSLVRLLKESNPEHEFHIVLGADILKDLPKWKGREELFTLAKPFFIGRAGYVPEPTPDWLGAVQDMLPSLGGTYVEPWTLQIPGATYLLNLRSPEVSSTEVRQRILKGESLAGLVPLDVEWMIGHMGLYGVKQPSAA